jgi:nitric oxide reductase subunit B
MEENRDIKLLRNVAILSFIISVTVLIVGGIFAMKKVPPRPAAFILAGKTAATEAAPTVAGTTTAGTTVIDLNALLRGQDVYQRYGLMDHGSVWGTGTYRAMDFSADTLHRMGADMRDFYASQAASRPEQSPSRAEEPQSTPISPSEGAFDTLEHDQKVIIDARVSQEIHANKYDPAADTVTITPARAYAIQCNRRYWDAEFGQGDTHVGFLPDTVRTAEERRDIADFFFWTAWAASTNRPGLDYSYTNNWPADTSVGNTPTAETFIWTIVSILAFMVVLGVVVYIVHRYRFFFGEGGKGVQAAYRLMELPLTASQRATPKFFLVAALLFLVQILNGGLLANYTANPGHFYIETVGRLYPYSWAKTWHVQLAILWIAIAWIGTSIYIAPLISRREPKGQSLLVNLLFWAVVVVLVGSLAGEVISIKGGLGQWWFWLGHQGWEYLELGRIWQWLLFIGLIFWLIIVYRTLAGVARGKDQGQDAPTGVCTDEHTRALVIFYILSAILIVVFFAFGLFYGRGTHLTIADYWRWFVVHIWVESIFEFFGVAVIAMFLVTLGLVSARSALRVAYLTAILVFFGGILGVAHHYFWYGGPSFWLAIGGVFSSLEPIPLILLVVRAWMEYRSISKEGRQFPYRWPLYFLVASSVWNFIGAAVFGFIINLPLVNYYEHGTYLTANHAHTALFGVYGMLAISLMMFSWRGLVQNEHWNDKIIKVGFWGLNIGLFLMFLTSLLPMGIMQGWYSFTKGVWFARSYHFYDDPTAHALALWRVVPDTIVIVFGAIPILYFLLKTFPKLRKTGAAQKVNEE